MKLKNIYLLFALTCLTACYTSNKISRFSTSNINLGMDKSVFIQKYGEPFTKEISHIQNRQEQEKLFYKEELYKGSWYIVTTAFTFIDNKLVKQEIVKEERTFQECDCNK